MKKTKIGIIGAGAIGCFVGGNLLSMDTEVYFLGRPRLGELIKEAGLTLTTLDNKSAHYEANKINWVLSPLDLPVLDLVIVTTKSHDTKSALTGVKSKITKNTVIVSLQNGLNNPRILNSLFPNNKIVTGMVLYNIIQIGETAHFKQATNGDICLSEEVPEFKNIKIEVTENITAIQYGKMIKNLHNALNALSNKPLIDQLKDKKERQLLSHIIQEALLILNKNSIKVQNTSPIPLAVFPYILNLPTPLYLFLAKAELKIDPHARLSMWQDLELKRKTEIEFLNGEIVGLAKKSGLRAPWNEKIVSLIQLAESGQLELAREKYQELISSRLSSHH